MIMPAMVAVVHQLQAGRADISLTVIVYMLGVTLSPLIVSPAANYFGKTKMILLGCGLFAIANLLCPFSTNIFQFLIFRLFQGVGQGFVFLGYTLIHESYEDLEAVRLTSLMGNITVFAPMLGPMMGSVIFVSLGWKMIFWLTGAFAFLSFIGLLLWVPELDKEKTKQAVSVSLSNYIEVCTSRRFWLVLIILSLAMVPSELWMIYSIIIILTSLKMNIWAYNVYMIEVVGASVLSLVIVRKLVTKFRFKILIGCGGGIFFIGSIGALFAADDSSFFVAFIALAVFGGGVFRGLIYRHLMTSVHGDKNAVSAMYNLLLSLALVLIIYCANFLLQVHHYSLWGLSLIIAPSGMICYGALLIYLILQYDTNRKNEKIGNSPGPL